MVSCVILFIADRVAPAFRFCLDNSTLAHACPIRYSFFYLSHIIVTPTTKNGAFSLRILQLPEDSDMILHINLFVKERIVCWKLK